MKKMNNFFNWIICLVSLIGLMGFTDMRDPTRPFGFVSDSINSEANSLDLTAIFIYPHYRMAIIGGQITFLGDKVGEYIVTNINSNTVELSGSDNKKLVLQLVSTIKQQRN